MSALRLAPLPSPVHQTNLTPNKGNALQACVASLFRLPLDSVPNFIELESGYESGIRTFCSDGGLPSAERIRKGKPEALLQEDDVGKYCLLRGKSPRGNHGHVVVARVVVVAGSSPSSTDGGGGLGFEMVHDPHPDATFLDGSEGYGWCMLFD